MSKQKVKIVSGWSNPGGSTVAHINLTNLLNDNGFDCTFYGPQGWHLDKCKADLLQKCELGEDVIVISHFLTLPKGMKYKKHILYCHETNMFPLNEIDKSQYDLIVYVSNSQRAYHSVNHPYMIIPPIVNQVEWKSPKNNIAGVIGSIDQNKQTHVAIRQALQDSYDKVLLFGNISNMQYFNKEVAKLVNDGKAVLMGHEDDQEKMYRQVSAVYHASLSETFGLVEAECRLSGIPFVGKHTADPMETQEILKKWKDSLI